MTNYYTYTGPQDPYYTKNKNYLLKVQQTFFRKHIKIANIHGFEDRPYGGSLRRYRDMGEFRSNFRKVV